MTKTPQADGLSDVAAAIQAIHEDMCDAMTMADISVLNDILAESYTLTHMTGYVQPKAEWLGDIDTDEMQYHSIEVVEAVADVNVAIPTLTARTITDATIWGGRGTWRLLLRSWFERRDDGWIISRTVASTW